VEIKSFAIFFGVILTFPIIQNAYAESEIPDWVKDVTLWWGEEEISDNEFVRAIEFLIENKILLVDDYEKDETNFLNGEKAYELAKILQLETQACLPFESVNNIVVVGDVGTSGTALKTLKNIEATDPEVILFVGDLSYSTPQDWFDISDFLGKEKIFIAIGNHELDGYVVDDWLTHYELEKEFYSFNFENVHFIALSTETSFSIGSPQFEFLENDLRSVYYDRESDWIIVWFHKPMYSDGGRLFIDFRHSLQPIFDLYNVDIVLQGHNHIYERSKPLKFNNIVTDNSTSPYVEPDGQIYITVGTGGEPLTEIHDKSHWSVVQNNKDFGFLNMKLKENGKKISAEFISNTGRFVDAFQICSAEKSRINLPIVNFVGKNLTEVIEGADLRFANLSGVDLSGIDLSGTNLMVADLGGTNLSGVNLSRIDLRGSILVGSDLSYANLFEVNLSGANLSGTILTNTNLSYANLFEADLSGVDLSGTILTNTNLANANLSGVDLSGKDLSGTNLSGVDLSGKDLSGTILTNTNLANANLSGVDLSGKDLSGTILTNTNLAGANLSGVDLSRKDLTGVNLSGNDLSGKDFTGTLLVAADLSNTNLSLTKLVDARLDYANLDRANLSGANLSYANLSYAYLSGTDFTNAITTGCIGCP